MDQPRYGPVGTKQQLLRSAVYKVSGDLPIKWQYTAMTLLHHIMRVVVSGLLRHGNLQATVEIPKRSYAFTLAGACLLILSCLAVNGQTLSQRSSIHPQVDALDKDSIAILEIGAATSWNFSGGAATFAPDLAAEVTPIENWLELEAGVSPFYTRNSTEWDTDLLLKKPWTLSRKTEFMFGVGPEWVHLRQNDKVSNSIAGEVAGDFMFWPTGRHRFG